MPDSDSFQADLVSPGYKYDSAGRLLIESKQDMRKRGIPSPDEVDVSLGWMDSVVRLFIRQGSNKQEIEIGYETK